MLGEIVKQIQQEIDQISSEDYQLAPSSTKSYVDKYREYIEKKIMAFPEPQRTRLAQEFFEWGPLTNFIEDPQICEILVNGPESLWIERNGELLPVEDQFLTPITYRNIMDRICQEAQTFPTAESPIADGHWKNFRLNFVRSEIHPEHNILSLRRHPENGWTLHRLAEVDWCSPYELNMIRHWIHSGKNFLVIGPTSSGKTSILNACLAETKPRERSLILEDSSEIKIPNKVSLKLLTRKDSQGQMPEVSLSDLLRTALRLRPDRLVIGEMRGAEAKDFLLALSSGHRGSLGTLHAEDAAQALIRLEMLVQLGAPQWNLTAIRRLIRFSLDGVLVTGRDHTGQRKFKGLYSISSLEENGFTLEKLDSETYSAVSAEAGPSYSLASV